MKDQLVIHASRWKLVLHVIYCVVIILIGLLFFIVPWGQGSAELMWILGGFLFIVAGSLLKFVISTSLRREPVFIIDAQGIYDNASFTSIGYIKWEEISKIYISRRLFSHYLFIFPKDYDSILSRQPFMKKIVIRMFTFMIHGFEIPASLFDGSFDEIEQFMRKFFEITT
ncbi:MAG: hypothetical protein HXS44_02440 [Theionarchaea archaeon]|nr:hypothetical protein [Theionarchaea archaeon]